MNGVGDDRQPPRRFGFRFNPEFNVGNVLSGVVVAGALVTGYVGFRVEMDSRLNDMKVALATYEARLTVAEHAIIERRDEERQFATEMRGSLNDIQKALYDLNLQLVKVGKASR